MSRISPLFERLRAEQRLGLFTYVTVGYPELGSTPDVAIALAEAGADLIELVIPFSAPRAEGRTVQATSQRALQNGVNVGICLETAWAIRQRSEVPMVFMGYLNPILAYGVKRFTEHAPDVAIDELIVADLSLEETADLLAACRYSGLDLIFFLAPTSTETRMRLVAEHASGFIYCISVTGVTGSRQE